MIFIDAIIEYPASLCGGLPNTKWCHLISDVSDVELHAFAQRIGLKREWAQLPPKSTTPHYDLTPNKRALAVSAGAIEADRRTFIDAIRRRRRVGDID